MSAEEMGCQELVEVITGYLEGKMSPADRQRFEAHLSICPGCQLYLDQMRAMVRAMGNLQANNLTPESQRELLGLFRGWKSS